MEKILFKFLVVTFALSYLNACGMVRGKKKVCPESIFYNARVYKSAYDTLPEEAFSIYQGRFLNTGRNREVIKSQCRETKIFNLHGATVIPGFIDSHFHLFSTGFEEKIVNLKGIGSLQEVLDKIQEESSKLPDRAWIIARGWDQNLWKEKEFPNREMMDRITGNHPASAERVDGHALWVNTKVLEMAGINSSTPDPEGGKIIKDADGNPTGILLDKAASFVERIMPVPSRNEKVDAIKRAISKCLSHGITMVHDAGVDGETVEILKEMEVSGQLPLRVYAMINWESEGSRNLIERGSKSVNDRLWVRAVKFFLDGALGSRGAALIDEYFDQRGWNGVETMSREDFKEAVSFVVAKGFQPAVHAIGDKAVRTALDVYEEILKSRNKFDIRPRVEHAQVVSPGDIPRFGKLGIIASMQPVHCTSDMVWAERRLGFKRSHYAYAWRKLLEGGAIIASGSDSPVEEPDPLMGIYSAVTRRNLDGYPAGGWFRENKMSIQEAVASFTLMGAKASFTEKLFGTIEEGKLADFIVLDKDIFSIPVEKIPSLKVMLTVIGGRIVYRNQEMSE